MNNKKSNEIVAKVITDRLFRLFFLFSFYQFTLHLYFSFSEKDPRLFMPTTIAFLHDLALLALVTAFGYLATLASSIQLKSIVNKTFSIILIITGILLSTYPKILREFIVFPVNIFDSDMSSAKTLVLDYLGFATLLPSLVALVFGVIVFRIKNELHISNRLKAIGFIIILLFFGFTLQRISPQPFIYSLQKKAENIIKGEKRAVASLNRNRTKEVTDNINQLEYSLNVTCF